LNAFQYTYDGSGVTVYYLGEAINTEHREFMQGTATNGWLGKTSQESVCSTWHGTHVSALISGATYGVAKRATVVGVAVSSGCRQSMPISNYVRGLQWVVDQRRKNPSAPAILLTSPRVPVRQLDTTAAMLIEDLVGFLLDLNVTVVSAIGGSGADACAFTPPRMDRVISVGAAEVFETESIGRMAQPWSKTNFGKCVNVLAPGSYIESAFAPSTEAVAVYSGSSQASGLVAGLAALILQEDPSATPDEVMRRIMHDASSDRVLMYSRPGTVDRVLQMPPAFVQPQA
jgi:subtilisin family serine protease